MVEIVPDEYDAGTVERVEGGRGGNVAAADGVDGANARVGGGAVTVLPARHTAALDAAGALHMQAAAGHHLADPLIRSVAAQCGPRALCVVLTGRLDDAANGVRILKRHGGRTIVQDPTTAAASGMPCAAWPPAVSTWSCRCRTSRPH
jgi:CheB methylesterase